jgi:hypothetical protein
VEAKLHDWLTNNVADYALKDHDEQEAMICLGRLHCVDHQAHNFAEHMQRTYLDAGSLAALDAEPRSFGLDGTTRFVEPVQTMQVYFQGPGSEVLTPLSVASAPPSETPTLVYMGGAPPSETPTLVYMGGAPPSDQPTLQYQEDHMLDDPIFDDIISNASTKLE